ncbi:MAG: glutathione-regulated potassium-efflux system ancillary protein KefC [Halieaceae bacterium]|jgi:glutathione-regulated potassium-efflux system ancillary protein KefC
MIDPLIILVALLCGMLSRALGLPALIGYLAAGFVLHEINVDGGELLQQLSEIGITLLLFTIGLKLQPKDLLQTKVWGTTLIHMTAMQLFFMGVLYAAGTLAPGLLLDLTGIVVIAFALTFSSTVFVIQIMQERGEMASRHANLAISILIIQDLAAVAFLASTSGKVPDLSALALLLLFPLRPVILRLLTLAGHGELFTLCGLALALGGGALFELVDIKGDLGVLIIGAALANSQKAKELSRNLLQFKDLFLVGFFLSIGLGGFPQTEIMVLAVLIGLLSLVKPLLYFPLMTIFHTTPRTATLTSATLTNYSEFGLIVIAVAASAGWVDNQWIAGISLAIAVSFLIASPMNKYSHQFYHRYRSRLQAFESRQVRGTYPDTSGVKVIVLGMGNIGTGAYDSIAEHYGGEVLGVDDNDRKLERHRKEHRRVAAADASDPDFWFRLDLKSIELIMLALTNHQENILVATLLEDLKYQGKTAAVVRFSEESTELELLGISVFNLYAQAGAGFAAHAAEIIAPPAEREN